MKLPFTVEPFFDVCIRYNESVWPMQFVLYVAALGTIVLLWLSPRARYVNRIISSILLFFWLWMAIAYHLLFLSAINRAAWLFGAIFILCAALFAWYGVLEERLQFRMNGSVPSWLGVLLISFVFQIAFPFFPGNGSSGVDGQRVVPISVGRRQGLFRGPKKRKPRFLGHSYRPLPRRAAFSDKFLHWWQS